MALTLAQKLSVYECLGVTYGTGGGDDENKATIHNHFGVELTLTEMNKLRERVAAHLDGLSVGDAEALAVEAKIAGLVTAWDAVRLCTGKMEGGSIGDISGMTDSFEDKRKNIQWLMQQYVPVMDWRDSLKRKNGGERPLTIGIMR